MLLSVCLITKNEERFLAGCLESVRAVADEIVLVDTGSVDRTVEIAQELGCRVLHRAWDEDFSAARNAGIAVARGRWILCLDADERVSDPAALLPAIREAAPEVGGFLIERHDVVTQPDGQTDVYPIEILRLFRNHPDLRYEGIVHERPNETVLRAGFQIRSLSTLKLEHLVNHLPQERLEAKQRGYLRLLDRELERDARNFWAQYYRGKTLWFLRRLDEAESMFRGITDDEGSPLSLKASAWCMLAALLSEEGLRGAAVECVKESLALIPGQSLAYYVLAEVLYADGRFAHALAAYGRVRRSMDPESGPSQVLGDLCMTAGKRGYKLGCCHLALGALAAAEERFREGLAGDPNHAGCHYGLARVAELQGDRAGVLEHLEAAVRLDSTWRAPRELLAELAPAQQVGGPAEQVVGSTGQVTGPAKQVSGPATQVVGPGKHAAGPATQVTGPAEQMVGPTVQVSGPAAQVAGPAGQVVGPEGKVAGPAGQITGTAGQVAGPAGQIAGSAGRVAGSAGPVVCPTGPTTDAAGQASRPSGPSAPAPGRTAAGAGLPARAAGRVRRITGRESPAATDKASRRLHRGS